MIRTVNPRFEGCKIFDMFETHYCMQLGAFLHRENKALFAIWQIRCGQGVDSNIVAETAQSANLLGTQQFFASVGHALGPNADWFRATYEIDQVLMDQGFTNYEPVTQDTLNANFDLNLSNYQNENSPHPELLAIQAQFKLLDFLRTKNLDPDSAMTAREFARLMQLDHKNLQGITGLLKSPHTHMESEKTREEKAC